MTQLRSASILGEVLGLDDRDPVPAKPPLDASALAAYEGTFHHSFGHIVVTAAGAGHPGELVLTHLRRPDGEVRWQPPPPPTQRAAFWIPDELVVVDPTGFAGLTQTVGRAPDGSLTHLLWNGRMAPRASREDRTSLTSYVQSSADGAHDRSAG